MTARFRSLRMMALAAAASLAVVATPTPAHAVVAAAGPGAFAAGFATPVVVAPSGGPVTFVNSDLADHTLTATDAKLPRRVAKKTSWCRSYSVRSCPLFTTGVVGSQSSGDVEGLKRIKPGKQYAFKCEIHGSMTGTLVAAGAPQ